MRFKLSQANQGNGLEKYHEQRNRK